jgi:hypothetical protein
MNPGTLLLIIFAVIIAFWAGSRWRHHTRTWKDHKGAVAGEKSLRALRWVTLRAAAVAAAAVLFYLLATGAVSFAGLDGKAKPAAVHDASPTPGAHKTHGAATGGRK